MRKIVLIGFALIFLLYGGLVGSGAFFQLEGAAEIRQLKEEYPDGGDIDLSHYQQTVARSNNLKTAAKYGAIGGIFLASIFTAAGSIKLRRYIVLVFAPLLGGVLAILPFWMQSDVGAVNYYQEQMMIVGFAILCTAIVALILFLRQKSPLAEKP